MLGFACVFDESTKQDALCSLAGQLCKHSLAGMALTALNRAVSFPPSLEASRDSIPLIRLSRTTSFPSPSEHLSGSIARSDPSSPSSAPKLQKQTAHLMHDAAKRPATCFILPLDNQPPSDYQRSLVIAGLLGPLQHKRLVLRADKSSWCCFSHAVVSKRSLPYMLSVPL